MRGFLFMLAMLAIAMICVCDFAVAGSPCAGGKCPTIKSVIEVPVEVVVEQEIPAPFISIPKIKKVDPIKPIEPVITHDTPRACTSARTTVRLCHRPALRFAAKVATYPIRLFRTR